MKTLPSVLVPILEELVEGRSVAGGRWAELPVPDELLARSQVSLDKWRAIWESAVSGEPLELEPGQQLTWEAARSAILHLSQVRQVMNLITPDLLESVIADHVMPDLPPGITPSREVNLVLGTFGGGFIVDTRMYLDLDVLRDMRDDPQALVQFLAHELWHTAHARALEEHPLAGEPWFGPLASNQSEAMVNHLIGGTRELMERTARLGEGATRERAEQFLMYMNHMEENLPARMAELWDALARLLAGDRRGFQAYQATLPDVFGYLHGPLMARRVDERLGRRVLLGTLADPAAFYLAYHSAAQVGGGCAMPEELVRTLEKLRR